MQQRSVSSFNPSWTLFSDPSLSVYYDEVDLAPVLWGHMPGSQGGPPGDPALISGRHWCIAVTVKHRDADPGPPATPSHDWIQYAWLDDLNSPSGGAVTTGILYDGQLNWDIQSAKVAAIYYSWGNPHVNRIEAVAAFMRREKSAQPGDPWQIATMIPGWLEQGFPYNLQVDPNPQLHFIPGVGNGGNWSPDVAYDYVNGRKHLVWTAWTGYWPDSARIAYSYGPYGGWDTPEILFDPNGPTQEWIPRIAVGNAGVGDDDQDIAIVYTEWSSGSPQPMHVGCVYWSVFDFAHRTYLHLPYLQDYPAGLPRIEIATANNHDKYASIVFTQETADGYQAVEVNNIRDGSSYFEHFWPIHNGDNAYGILPSVTCHRKPGNPACNSICYFERDIDDPDVWGCYIRKVSSIKSCALS
jgi:hypothetical protein